MIYSKTSTGQQVIRDRSVSLTPRQRTTLILVDGKRTMQELLRATSQTGGTAEDLESLVALGLIEAPIDARPPGPIASSETAPASDASPQRSEQDRFAQGYPVAAQLTASLGLRGFRLNLAVEAAGNYQELLALVPKIRDAVGAEKCAPLVKVLTAP